MIARETIDKVFETARVEEVIGDFVNLKKAGSNFKGLSPFADEKTPSFMVSPVKQIWKDFSTGKGGNAITFLMEHEHYSYPEAIRYLAKKYQIEIEETVQTDQEKKRFDERESLFLVSEYAKNYFTEILWNSEKGKAIGLTYFKERGFTEETIKKFELGYCTDEWSAFTDTALEKKYELEFLEGTGLTIVKENRKFDRFKGRVMFPIHSMSGRILGFGGRTLSSDKRAAKYLNSPESLIYHKSKILYGIYQAKQRIAKEDNCYLVEGYTDVISMWQSGIENVVASSGTALTPDQIRLINRLTNNITVLFDGDAAGIRASLRGIDLILEQGLNVKVVTFPEGEDPDSFAKSKTEEELKSYLEGNSQDFIQFKTSLLLEETKNDPIKRAGLIRDIVASISKIPNNIQKEIYVQECARIMNISESVLFNELSQILKRENKSSVVGPAIAKTPFTGVKKETKEAIKIDQLFQMEKKIIEILLLYGNQEVDFIDFTAETDDDGKKRIVKTNYTNEVCKEIYMHLQEDEIEFTNPVFLKIYYEIIHLLNQEEKISADLFTNHEDQEVAATVTDILMDEERYVLSNWEKHDIYVKNKESYLPKLVMDVLYNLRRLLIAEKIQALKSNLKNNQEEQQQAVEIDNSEMLESIRDYTALKQLLFEKLNRVI
ncbi:DNA primase [Lutimonas zeaxanthinifaciens]|uniref:DNA primase n=1 Tax=Lutimonas zeaxanthinifaciens TaxID=3060215 RepID=UPI00265D12DC|nr:DNA primase [Lutimonas sp. YSD2104]WKK65456.1 DNA primase [Lutimonas sp. YSD2104]